MLVKVKGLTKSFAHQEVLKGVDICLDEGDVISLLGQSGGGKSTLLRCLNFLETPTDGQIHFKDKLIFDGKPLIKTGDLIELRRRLGMVFQQFNLFPHLTAIENIILPLTEGAGLATDEAIDRGTEALARVGVKDKALSYPETLSGGEQQRVSIARTLALRPAVLLVDEPTSSLDPESTSEVLGAMRELAGQGIAMIVATHEIGFARDVSDRTVFIDRGRIVEEGPSEKVLNEPEEERTRAFLQRVAAVGR